MHIEQEKVSSFNPVTLRFDTEKELRLFFHMLDCAFDKSLKQYCSEKENKIDADEMTDFSWELWDSLKKVYVYEDDC